MKTIFKSKRKNIIELLLYATVLAGCNGCSTSHKTEQLYLQVSPEQANTGQIIYLYDSTRSLKPDSNYIVKFNESTGTILKTDNIGQIAVMVPNLKQGDYKISLLKNKDTVGFSTLKIGATPALMLVLSISDKHEVKIVQATPYNGDYQSGFTQSGSQLSFDLTDGSNVFYSASIPDPVTAGMEVFKGKDSTLSHEKMHGMENATFAIKVPNIEHATLVKFYTSNPGTNLLNAEGRKARKLVSQISLEIIQK